jgi:phosphonoacetaldehyde hydrolase
LSTASRDIRLVVFDWAGTTIDHGCFGPVAAFVAVFASHGIEVTVDQARGPMGLHKKDHLREMLHLPQVCERWRQVHQRDWNEQDVETLYRAFVPLQLEVIEQHSQLVPGVLECVAELRRRGMRIAGTTGYFREAAECVYRAARQQGFEPDYSVCAEDVAEGRPAPWMVFRAMEALRVYPPAAVVKVGDTVPDIGEGLHAGAWSVGVTAASSAVGCTAEQLAALPQEVRRALLQSARNSLLDAGAHAVIESLAELPELLTDLASRGRQPPEECRQREMGFSGG